ncbi:aminoglycoside phosphotransferase family protein [Streptomyces sp. NPDC002215]|uniref:phosphotransferase enzyme family protein n=1 Tax=Streptomyces sp. NPDC002215 TaxID=3154412 RepID=UPI00331810DE
MTLFGSAAGYARYRPGIPDEAARPGDAIAYDAGADRLRLVPDVDSPPARRPDAPVVEFTQSAVGRITGWEDVSWVREGSRVWRARGAGGGTWCVKIHQSDKFHAREVRAYRTWALSLGGGAPRLVASDEKLRAVVLTSVPGRPLHGAVLSPGQERDVFQRIGALARRIHQASAPRPASESSGPAVGKAERHLTAARHRLAPGDEEFVRGLVRQAKNLPLPEQVETHGDFQLRNILCSDDVDGFLAVIDLERSDPGPAVRNLVRLSDAWAHRPDLYEALLAGYGRTLTDAEESRLVIDSALDAVRGVAFGAAHGDPELVERGRRTPARLRTERRSCNSPTGESP